MRTLFNSLGEEDSTKGMKTLHDIAQLAGVSTATVSHVINGTRFVSQALQDKVLAAMKELDYQPKAPSQQIKPSLPQTIAVVVPDNSQAFFAELIRYIEQDCFQCGYNMILCNTLYDNERKFSCAQMLIAKHIDGVILLSIDESNQILDAFLQHAIPVVVVDRSVMQRDVDSIYVDNVKGGLEATKYLINLGFDKIGCLSGPSYIESSCQRVTGYLQALREAQIPLREDYIFVGDFTYQGGATAIESFFSLDVKPEALFVANDMMALGAMKKLQDNGYAVPQDISIIGFDDIQLATYVAPQLTTISQPLAQLAHSAAKILLHKIGHKEVKAQKIILDSLLVVRDSCQSKGAQ